MRQDRGNIITDSSRTGDTNSSSMRRTQREIGLSSHFRDSEYHGRSAQPKADTSVRVGITMEMVQPSKKAMRLRQIQNRCVCNETEQETTCVLESIPESQYTSNWHISPKVADEGTLLESTMEINPKDFEKTKRRQSQANSVDHTVMANPILMELAHEDTITEDTNKNETQLPIVLSRVKKYISSIVNPSPSSFER